jgi:hypothetical protein
MEFPPHGRSLENESYWKTEIITSTIQFIVIRKFGSAVVIRETLGEVENEQLNLV